MNYNFRLDKLSSKEKIKLLSERFGVKVTPHLEQGVAELCNLSEGIEKRGEERGIAIGEERGKKDILLSLIKSGLDPKYLANSTGIPLEKINELIQATSQPQ